MKTITWRARTSDERTPPTFSTHGETLVPDDATPAAQVDAIRKDIADWFVIEITGERP